MDIRENVANITENARENERAELYKTIWNIATDLRGSVDGWDFKNYVFTTLFYRYVSENLTNYINKNEWAAGNTDFDYAKISDEWADDIKNDIVESKGFFIKPSELFCNVVESAKNDLKNKSESNLNERLSQIFRAIQNTAKGTNSEKNVNGLFSDFDVNSNKLGNSTKTRNQKLANLLISIAGINFNINSDTSIDTFGDAYEYLMGMYAANAGKSGGEYFTPQEVSELLTKIALNGRDHINTIYDPCCGSGSLLLKGAKLLGENANDIHYYGQEVNITTYNLCRINMFLHDVGYENFDIANADTLLEPAFQNQHGFDAIVSNPPYSTTWPGSNDPLLINDERFSPAGVLAPKSKADLAFVMHCLANLSVDGTAAIVCFPGIMYRGGAEQKIRKYLIDNNYIDAVIQLSDKLFYIISNLYTVENSHGIRYELAA